jgi:cell division septation protein DedD
VSAVETPTPPPEVTHLPRRCPRCGATLTPEQEWCLECGADVGTTIAAPPSWRGPVALVAVLLVVAAAALILALVELAGDAEQVGEAQPTATATPPAAVAPTATPAPESTTIPPAASTPGATGATGEIAEWPAGTEAWTVVLESASTEDAARARAEELAGLGVSVGMLDSDDYGSLEPGRNVVFSGQYDSQRAADQARSDLEDQVEGAYVVRVAPE